jgi:hypothetical protein
MTDRADAASHWDAAYAQGDETRSLNAGVPANTIARRAGHSVDVLLRVYANCIDGDEEIANQRITVALA